MSGEATVGSKFSPDREKEIRERYDDIMKYETVLADIGTCAFCDIMATAQEHHLLVPPGVDTPPTEMIGVVVLFRQPLHRTSSGQRIWLNHVGRELGYRKDDLFCRRCVELPKYYEVLSLHRNKWAHKGAQVTVDSLSAFAGAVLGVLELASDEWADGQELRDAAEQALKWAAYQTEWGEEDASDLRGELEQRDVQLAKLKSELQELKAERSQSRAVASNEDPEIVTRVLATAKAHITKKVNEAREEMEQHLVRIGDAVTSLRSEVLDTQGHAQSSVDDEDEEGVDRPARGGHPPQLTGGQASEKLRDAFQRMRARGFDISSNVFQRWIVEDALKAAAAGEMSQVDDWWKLPSVLRKTEAEKDQMSKQLEIPQLEDWMMDIYRRVERRSGATSALPPEIGQ